MWYGNPVQILGKMTANVHLFQFSQKLLFFFKTFYRKLPKFWRKWNALLSSSPVAEFLDAIGKISLKSFPPYYSQSPLLSRLCTETSKKWYVHEFRLWSWWWQFSANPLSPGCWLFLMGPLFSHYWCLKESTAGLKTPVPIVIDNAQKHREFRSIEQLLTAASLICPVYGQ